jgi:hypothetical protein
MNSQIISLCLAVITLPVIAIGASTAGRAQSKLFDGAYKGSLECERMTAGVDGAFRAPLSIIIREGTVVAAFDIEDTSAPLQAMPLQAAGTIDPDGAFRFGVTAYTQKYNLRAEYSGTLNDTAGTLTGTQVLTRQVTGDGRTRACKGTFLKVELPRR